MRAVGDADGLETCAEQIDAWVLKFCGARARVIEDWASAVPRYRVLGDDGERMAADVADLGELGLLPARDASGSLISG